MTIAADDKGDVDLTTYENNESYLCDEGLKPDDAAGDTLTLDDCQENLADNGSSDSNGSNHYGYWVWSSHLYDLNLTDLSNNGVTDIILNYKVFNLYNKTDIETWIGQANEKGIHTHLWAQIFYQGSWVRPISREGVVNYEFFDKKIEELERYANTSGVYGIHYDYLRFSGSEKYNNTGYQNPGGMEAITYFVNESAKAIRRVNPNLTLSAAIMPEPDNLGRLYDDDYSELSRILDVIIPMSYVGNYRQDTEWLKQTVKWFVDNSQGAEVWAGIQGYSITDNDEEIVSKAPLSQLNIDIQSALDSNASGAIVFRYAITPNINFNNLSVDEDELASFSYLNYLISNAKEPIKLTRDITFNEKYDADFINGIVILKDDLVIDGGNHVVDAKGIARILNITGKGNTVMNFTFVNAFADKGGAIYIGGNDTKIINCTFINDIAGTEAGSIYLRAPRGQIINSTFINSTAFYTGAVLVNSVNASVIGCYFENNRANISAGALGWAAKDNGIIKDCIFANNSAHNEGGGALFWNKGKNGIIENSTFMNNYANYNGSAIFWSFGEDGQIIDSVFINNNATVSGGAIYLKGENNVIRNSIFSNNTAKLGNAINTEADLDVLKCSFENNDVFAKEGAIVNVVSNPDNIQIVAKSATYTINYAGKYSVTLKDSKGNLIKGKNLTFTLKGKNIGTATTNAKGIATIKITAKALKTAKSGKRNLVIKFNSKNYASANKTVKITISKEKTKLSSSSKTFKRTVKTKKYSVTLKDSKNKAIGKAKVTLKVNGKTYKATTNSKGKATFKITKLTKKGTFKAKISYAGNDCYKAVSKSVNIKIK